MSFAIENYTGITLQRINNVRKFLKDFFISDLSTSCRKYISSDFLYSNRIPIRTPLLTWPNQECPGPTAWKEWRTFLQKYICTFNLRLHRQLGKWFSPSQQTQTWDTLIYPTTMKVYIKANNKWTINTTRGLSWLHFLGQTSSPPPNLLPVTIIDHQVYSNRSSFHHRIQPRPLIQPSSLTFKQFLKMLPSHERIIIGHVIPLQSWELKNLADILTSGTYSISSDGSIWGSTASYSSMIQNNNIL